MKANEAAFGYFATDESEMSREDWLLSDPTSPKDVDVDMWQRYGVYV